jgi:hypothetical protein
MEIRNYIRSKTNYTDDPYWTFDFIMDIEKRYGFNSSFYFMIGGNSQYDNNYNIKDKRVVKLIDRIIDQRFEAGYHGSFNSYNDLSLMSKEACLAGKFNKNTKYGCRQHYLRFGVPYTWRYQEASGFLYDTTVGYADNTGFRCGICHPFKPYDLHEDRVMNIWEIPLVVMDDTLYSYLALTKEKALFEIEYFFNEIKKHNGVFTFLIHNSSFANHSSLEWEKVYPEILKTIYENNGKGINGREVIDKWIKN